MSDASTHRVKKVVGRRVYPIDLRFLQHQRVCASHREKRIFYQKKLYMLTTQSVLESFA